MIGRGKKLHPLDEASRWPQNFKKENQNHLLNKWHIPKNLGKHSKMQFLSTKIMAKERNWAIKTLLFFRFYKAPNEEEFYKIKFFILPNTGYPSSQVFNNGPIKITGDKKSALEKNSRHFRQIDNIKQCPFPRFVNEIGKAGITLYFRA